MKRVWRLAIFVLVVFGGCGTQEKSVPEEKPKAALKRQNGGSTALNSQITKVQVEERKPSPRKKKSAWDKASVSEGLAASVKETQVDHRGISSHDVVDSITRSPEDEVIQQMIDNIELDTEGDESPALPKKKASETSSEDEFFSLSDD